MHSSIEEMLLYIRRFDLSKYIIVKLIVRSEIMKHAKDPSVAILKHIAVSSIETAAHSRIIKFGNRGLL